MDTLTAPGNQSSNPALLKLSEQPVSILTFDLIILENIKVKSALFRGRRKNELPDSHQVLLKQPAIPNAPPLIPLQDAQRSCRTCSRFTCIGFIGKCSDVVQRNLHNFLKPALR